MLLPILTSSILILAIMLILWLIQLRTQKADIVDIAWSYNFAIIAIINLLLGNGFSDRKWMITIMVSIWSIRLGTHLYTRVMRHKEEEGRYLELRREWAANVNWKFFAFFMFQALLNIVLSLPIFISCANAAPTIHLAEYTGIAIGLLGVCGEALADYQLKQFKANPANKGKVCQYGLWNYSRHPNYFFEWLIWVAYFVFALASPWGWVSIICPAMMLFFLLKVTGIPMTEEQSIRSRGDAYCEYQRTTSVFVPWFKKSSNSN